MLAKKQNSLEICMDAELGMLNVCVVPLKFKEGYPLDAFDTKVGLFAGVPFVAFKTLLLNKLVHVAIWSPFDGCKLLPLTSLALYQNDKPDDLNGGCNDIMISISFGIH
jgi:hypothetical protein